MSMKWRNCFRNAANKSSNVLERARRARSQAKLLARPWVSPIIQGQFQDLRQVKVARQDVGFFAKRPHFHAPAAPAGPGVFEVLALPQLLLDHGIRVEDGGETAAAADDSQRVVKQSIGSPARKLDVGAGLKQLHVLHDLQQEMGNLVRTVRAIPEQPADIDVGKVSVSAALGRGDPDLGRGRMVVELDEEALQQLAS